MGFFKTIEIVKSKAQLIVCKPSHLLADLTLWSGIIQFSESSTLSRQSFAQVSVFHKENGVSVIIQIYILYRQQKIAEGLHRHIDSALIRHQIDIVGTGIKYERITVPFI